MPATKKLAGSCVSHPALHGPMRGGMVGLMGKLMSVKGESNYLKTMVCPNNRNGVIGGHLC